MSRTWHAIVRMTVFGEDRLKNIPLGLFATDMVVTSDNISDERPFCVKKKQSLVLRTAFIAELQNLVCVIQQKANISYIFNDT